MSPLSPYGDTSVSIAQSKANVEALLEKYGVVDVRWTQSGSSSVFAIEFNFPVKRTLVGKERVTPRKWIDKYRVDLIAGVRLQIPWPANDREQRRLARVLYWHLKSKLEAVEAGLVAFEEEFLPHLHIGSGRTMYAALAPMLERARETGDLSIGMGQELHALRALGSGEER